jgi:two-component system chemotaxis response regulator CheY
MTKTIMVVDDSSSVRQMMSFTLENAGYEVVEAEDGQDALEKLVGSAVNMIVTDLNMPNVNGIELIRSIRSQSEHKYIPIVVLTTESHESRKQESREAGATGWITKPFIPEQLIGVIKKVMPQ